ncbi:MAG: hypothetical protein QM831_36670 [Kofleriaceae bacterium]
MGGWPLRRRRPDQATAPHQDLGVMLGTLRHEAMHAQLHAGAGCIPAWLDEGLAQQFGHSVPVDEWLG